MKRWSRIVAMVTVLSLVVVACTESGSADPGEVVEPVATGSPDAGSDVVPIPEGQSLMEPGRYLARISPEAVVTTTTPWYGAANVPGFVNFGQLDEIPYAELYVMNLEEVFADPSAPGEPFETMPAPDDLFAWFVESTGAETVGEPTTVEIDGYEGQQADLRVGADTTCAPEDERPFPEACLLIFPIGPDVFAFIGVVAYRLIVLRTSRARP